MEQAQVDDLQPAEVGPLVPISSAPLAVPRDPMAVLEEAQKAAVALKTIIDGKKKKVVFNGETYLENEDWLTVARFYGVTSRIRSTKFFEYEEDDKKVRGFEATAEAYLVSTGQVISMAESMCLSDEHNWKAKPLFQLRSMAQTRASSRVLRQVFGWVVVLAGYRPTPAEEMAEGNNRASVHRVAGKLTEGKVFDNCSIYKIGKQKVVCVDGAFDSLLAQVGERKEEVEVEVCPEHGPKGVYLRLVQIISIGGKPYLEGALQISNEAVKAKKAKAEPITVDVEPLPEATQPLQPGECKSPDIPF